MLSGLTRALLESEEMTAQLADGSRLTTYSTITMGCRVRTAQITLTFNVASITNDGILGMEVLYRYDCSLLVNQTMSAIEE